MCACVCVCVCVRACVCICVCVCVCVCSRCKMEKGAGCLPVPPALEVVWMAMHMTSYSDYQTGFRESVWPLFYNLYIYVTLLTSL